MPSPLPERLFASEARVKKVTDNQCGKCLLLRRTDLKTLRTPGGEISADIWSIEDIYGLSLNIYLCNIEAVDLESEKGDVLFIVKDYTKFVSDEQLAGLNKDVDVEVADGIIIGMLIESLEGMVGDFPFVKGNNETIYKYEVRVVQDALLQNTFHYVIEVKTNQPDKPDPIDRKHKKKSFVRSIASDIRNRMINGGLVSHVTLAG